MKAIFRVMLRSARSRTGRIIEDSGRPAKLGGQGGFTPTHRIDDACEEPQVGLAKPNPTLETKEPRVVRDVGLRFANPTCLLRRSSSEPGALLDPVA